MNDGGRRVEGVGRKYPMLAGRRQLLKMSILRCSAPWWLHRPQSPCIMHIAHKT